MEGHLHLLPACPQPTAGRHVLVSDQQPGAALRLWFKETHLRPGKKEQKVFGLEEVEAISLIASIFFEEEDDEMGNWRFDKKRGIFYLIPVYYGHEWTKMKTKNRIVRENALAVSGQCPKIRIGPSLRGYILPCSHVSVQKG